MEENSRYRAAVYRKRQAEELVAFRRTKDLGDRRQHKLMADFYGKQADEYEARANGQSEC